MIKRIILFFFIFLNFSWAFCDNIPEAPNPPRLVNDFAQVLSVAQRTQLEMQLDTFAQRTSTQIILVTMSTLDGDTPSDFSFKLGEKWGVGQKGKDNGVVILYKPKTKSERGQVFVAVGYGLEGVIPDAVAHRDIVENEMIPRFKTGDTYGGLVSGINVIMALTSGEYTAEQYHNKVSKSNGSGGLIWIILFFIFAFIIPSVGRKRRTVDMGARRGGLPFLFFPFMGGGGSGSSGGSGWNDFSGGSGGFGGFGGGGFGGGGAGGSW